MADPKFTKGPWAWFGNAASNSVYLATKHSGRQYVMQFRRWGFSGAQPVFQPVQGMVEAKNLLKFEVGDRSVTGVDEAKKNTSVYRTDICGIEAPDAHLIAAAPELYEALSDCLEYITKAGEVGIVAKAYAALAKAQGEAP